MFKIDIRSLSFKLSTGFKIKKALNILNLRDLEKRNALFELQFKV